MLKERHKEKLTKNQRKVLSYIKEKAENEHALTVECTVPELQEAFHFNSNKTAYNIVNQLIDKKLITKLGDELTLDADLFVFQKEKRVKKTLNLKFILQELETEYQLFPFLEPEHRMEYMKLVATNREEAMKYNPTLTNVVCKLVEEKVYEFPLKPLTGNPKYIVGHCVNILATCNNEEEGTFQTYEERELKQAIDYLRENPQKYRELAYVYSDYSKETVDYLFDKYVSGAIASNGEDTCFSN